MIKKLLQKTLGIYCWLILHYYVKIIVHHKENLPNAQYILISNHNSHLDYLILAIFSGKWFSSMSVIVAKDYWSDRKSRSWFTKTFLNAIAIDRKKIYQPKLLQQTLQKCKNEIGENKSLVIFPEGKRSQNGEIQPFKQGVSIIADALGLPVIPAYIGGTQKAWPKGSLFIRPQKIHVLFGKPLVTNDPQSAAINPKEITKKLENEVKNLQMEYESRQYII